jgi:hypothetical protein
MQSSIKSKYQKKKKYIHIHKNLGEVENFISIIVINNNKIHYILIKITPIIVLINKAKSKLYITPA